MSAVLNIKEQYIYLVLLIVLSAPLLRPIGLPLPIEDVTRKYYEGVEAIAAGSTVLMANDASAGTEMEIGLSSAIVTKHIFRLAQERNLKLIWVSQGVGDAPPIFEQTLKSTGVWDEYQRGYGDQYVYLGFIAGEEAACAAINANIRSATGGVDFYGNALDSMSAMDGVNTGADFDLVIAADEPGISGVFWMQQLANVHGIPIYVNPLAGVAGTYWPYIEAGQIDGMLIGSKAAAGYEILVGLPGAAAAQQDAQTLGHLYLATLVIVANIVHVAKKFGGS
jgi:hypothetical protein